MKKIIAVSAVIFITAAVVLYLYFDRLVVFFISNTQNLDISYRSMARASVDTINFKDLSVTDKKSGIGVFSKTGSIKPSVGFNSFKVGFDLQEVNFIRKKTKAATTYDSLTGLVAIPFNSNWKYERISGSVEKGKDKIEVTGLDAKSEDIRLSFNGTLYHDNNVKSEIKIYFSENLTKKIPDELSSVVLRQEGEGWKSLSVNLTGNFLSPAIQVSGKLFRLNIREKIIEKK